ncbi:hypothetical protein OCGS_2384 [Oceaniovalibus guishaninsula JLT2003]|uniref:PhiE125 gp8 family phage protein n=1 Tax=Oceaniovalibus guishaninsula JLT2003 TaxID=1231392 RepID=K2HAJ7_9RHOB|nr:hypothetical protein [Oceaniovalibus guishaninsula]EKE43652.1 hypothetical protein OCGS_2384 [Oceaniovalibus guishaninsula JLT2003]
MYLTEDNVPQAALPIGPLRAHLRLGSGFADDGVQDGVLEACLRAALARIEAQTARALVRRGFVQHLAAWRDLGRQSLMRAPLEAVTALRIVDVGGAVETVDPARYHVERDHARPCIAARGFVLPGIPVGGRAEIAFVAGFGPDWSDVPGDLALAALTLAAAIYEERAGADGLPGSVAALLAPWRPVRIWGGLV